MSPPAKFVRQNYFPKGWESCVSQFLELFHRYGYIYKPLSGGSWLSANEKWELTDSEILKAISCAHPRYYIGCRAGKASRFAVLDIDANSKYHNKQQLEKLLAALSSAGLCRSSLYRSSYSGGWHLYLFFDEPINSAELHRQIVKLLTLNDFEVSKGTLEVFPHPGINSMGLGLRLPLQPGFAFLDKRDLDLDYERAELSATKALEMFLDAMEGDANSYADFRQLKSHLQELESRKQTATKLGRGQNNVVPIRRAEKQLQPSEFAGFVRAVFGHLPTGMIVDNWYKGRLFHLQGLSGPSQRAEAITCVGHYLFYGDPSRNLPALGYGYEQERAWALREFLAARHNGQSEELNRGTGDALAQVERAANWRPEHKKDTEPAKYLPSRPVSWIRENANRKTDARKRITNALDALKQLKRSFTTVELQQAAGCSRATLYNHGDIWRQDYEDLADGFFAICTHEYNAVEGAGSQKTLPPTTEVEKITPPGLLAARRVAYELSMRSERQRRKSDSSNSSIDDREKKWLDDVTRVAENDRPGLSVSELKSLLTVLAHYLALAPNDECQSVVEHHIARVRSRLSGSFDRTLVVVRPP